MNLENIQERISDIQNLRFTSSQNEAAVSEKKQGNTIYKTEETKEGAETSFRMRFFIAVCLFGVFLWADKQDNKDYQKMVEKVQTTISYNLTFEDMKDICYTKGKEWIETIQTFIPDVSGK